MRISTLSLYSNATSQLNSLQSALARTQEQLATNRRIVSPSDDPIASARALQVKQSLQMNEQYATNRSAAHSSLAMTEGALHSAGSLVQDIQELALRAGSGILQASDREAIATELEGRLADLLGVANSTDGQGVYLFSGYRTTTQPYTATPDGARYDGDQGQRQLQVADSRRIPQSVPGSAVFDGNLTGNGRFQTAAAPANTGTGAISTGSVTGAAGPGGYSYALSFTAAGTFDVSDTSVTPPEVILPNQTYTAGKPISFGGVSVEIQGAPAPGDVFTVAPSTKESLFTTVTNMITALRAPADTAQDRVALTNSLSTATGNLAHALDKILTVRASVGAHMKELDFLDSAGDDLGIQYQATLSGLEDLDIVKAISEFSRQQTTLQAAQMSFKTMSGLSLFNYL